MRKSCSTANVRSIRPGPSGLELEASAAHTVTDIDFIPRGLRAARFELGGEELAVFRYDLEVTPSTPSTLVTLTRAEREVVDSLFEGLSNQQIGEKRGTATRTVANQIASIFRKLGVGSRTELLRKIIDSPKSC